MVTLAQFILFLHPDAVPLMDFTVVANAEGDFIAQWNADKLGPQPTLDEMEAHRAEAEAFYSQKLEPSMRDKIGELFAQMLAQPVCANDPALRADLYAAKVKILAAWDAGDMPVVGLVLQTQPLPAALEPFRAGAIAMLTP